MRHRTARRGFSLVEIMVALTILSIIILGLANTTISFLHETTLDTVRVRAPSFADIFHSNAGKNGILLVTLPESQWQTLRDRASNRDDYKWTGAREENTISDTEGFKTSFSIDPFRRDCLLEGLDDIGLTLRHAAELDNYEKQHDAAFWVKPRAGEQAQA